MKNCYTFLIITVILVIACGCTQSSIPEQPTATILTPQQTIHQSSATTIHVPKTTTSISTPSQPTATVTVPPQTTQQRTETTVPDLMATTSISNTTIRIKNFEFYPASITVKVGSTVWWVNQDYDSHRIVFADKMDSNVLVPGQSYSRKFDQVGRYDYSCMIHPTMYGTIVVE